MRLWREERARTNGWTRVRRSVFAARHSPGSSALRDLPARLQSVKAKVFDDDY
jgi:hypothetical protein